MTKLLIHLNFNTGNQDVTGNMIITYSRHAFHSGSLGGGAMISSFSFFTG